MESVSAGLKTVIPYCLGATAIQEQTGDSNIIAFGVNLKEKMVMKMGDAFQEGTVMDTLKINGLTEEDIAVLPRITKEEFYNLEV